MKRKQIASELLSEQTNLCGAMEAALDDDASAVVINLDSVIATCKRVRKLVSREIREDYYPGY